MNLPLAELFNWGSRPIMLGHHLRGQKFLQQTRIKQQRQGSPHRACHSWQFGLLSAAAVICQHSSKSQPCSWNGCQTQPLVGTEHRTASPTLCALQFARASSAPSARGAQAPFPLLPAGWRSPTQSSCTPGIYRGAAEQEEQWIYSRSAFPVIPSMSKGFIPPDQFRLGLMEVGKLPSLPSRGLVPTQGALTEPQEQ